MADVGLYPGVTGITGYDATSSVGSTPAIIGIYCYPDSVPDPVGDLFLGDGTAAPMKFTNCFLQYKETIKSTDSNIMILRLLDRRWQWKQSFPIDGHYNQQDRNRKLIPWTVASPYQLVRLCLAQMGEYPLDGAIAAGILNDIPGGLASPAVMGVMPSPGPLDKIIDPYSDYLRLGENFADTKTNPVTVWQATPAAIAMANMLEQYGLVPTLQLDDMVRVFKLGNGTALPAGGIHKSDGNSVTGEPIPTEIINRGNPTRFQPRLFCRPVGKDGDGNWYPHELLSYSPDRAGQKMQCRIIGGAYDATKAYGVKINGLAYTIAAGAQPDLDSVCAALAVLVNAGPLSAVLAATSLGPIFATDALVDGYEYTFYADASAGTTAARVDWDPECTIGPVTGVRDVQPMISLDFSTAGYVVGTVLTLTVGGFSVTIGPLGPATLAEALDLLAFAANGDADISPLAISAAGATTIVVTGATAGVAITATGASDTGTVGATTLVGTTFTPRGFEKGWGSFGWLAKAVVPGISLSYAQAKQLADETVFRCYQVMTVDPADPDVHTIRVPGYGSVNNRFRIVLQGSRPETIVPRPGEGAVIDLKTGQPYAADTYNGYSVDRPNVAYGSAWVGIILARGLGWYRGTYFGNTDLKALLPVNFSIIDPEKQVIQFDTPIYRILGKGAGYAACASDIVIEVGAEVLDLTYAPVRYTLNTAVAGGFAPPVVRVYPDVQAEVISEYNADHSVGGSHTLDADALNRATYYGNALAAVYQIPNGEIREYGGIEKLSTDGLVRQVNWKFDAKGGPSTTASTNTEFSRVIVPYQTRRRAENMPPDGARAFQNMMTDFRFRGALRAATAFLPRGSL